MIGRGIANDNGTNIRLEVQCAYCDNIELQNWVEPPFEDGTYLLDQEPVDLSGVG